MSNAGDILSVLGNQPAEGATKGGARRLTAGLSEPGPRDHRKDDASHAARRLTPRAVLRRGQSGRALQPARWGTARVTRATPRTVLPGTAAANAEPGGASAAQAVQAALHAIPRRNERGVLGTLPAGGRPSYANHAAHCSTPGRRRALATRPAGAPYWW